MADWTGCDQVIPREKKSPGTVFSRFVLHKTASAQGISSSMLVRELCVRRSLNWFFSGRNENRTNSLQNGKLCQMASINCFQQVKIIYMDNG